MLGISTLILIESLWGGKVGEGGTGLRGGSRPAADRGQLGIAASWGLRPAGRTLPHRPSLHTCTVEYNSVILHETTRHPYSFFGLPFSPSSSRPSN